MAAHAIIQIRARAPSAQVPGDAVHGADSSLRRMLESCNQPHVLAVRGAHFMRRGGDRWFEETSAPALAATLAPGDWACLAAGEGAKRARLCDWARIRRPWTSGEGFEHWLVVRRKRSKSAGQTHYLAFAPPGSTLAELAVVAAVRWAVEDCFERPRTISVLIVARRAPGTAGMAT